MNNMTDISSCVVPIVSLHVVKNIRSCCYDVYMNDCISDERILLSHYPLIDEDTGDEVDIQTVKKDVEINKMNFIRYYFSIDLH